MPKLLEGRVAVITGAGRGLGRAHALAMAGQGAKVVVNDLGGSADGYGADPTPAEQVAEEVRKAGGSAVASYDSVATPDGANRIIKAATDAFGRVDILVNNAGIIRDTLVWDTTDDDFDSVVKVNLYGAFYCARAACRIMKEQKYGRIINTSSPAGLGSAAQSSYAAAKEGVVGFTRSIGKELMNFGVTCNAIRPRAAGRMAAVHKAPELRKSLGAEVEKQPQAPRPASVPDDISPLVLYLSSERAGDVTCCVFEVWMNFIAIYQDPPLRARTIVKEGQRWSPEELLELLPRTLTADLRRPSFGFEMRNAPDARQWRWADGKLGEKR